MTHKVRRLLEWLTDSMRDDERAYGHYSRALGMLIRVAVLAMLVVAVVMAQQSPYANAACRMNAEAAQGPVMATDIELARDTTSLLPRLAGRMSFKGEGLVPATICVAERAERYARLLALDGALFIPAYLLLTVFSLCWLLAMSVRASGRRSGLGPLLVASGAVVLLTGGLDSRENRAALHVLEMASGVGALVSPSAELALAVAEAYRASLYKWLASGVWAATLAAAFWHQRNTLIAACGGASVWRGRTCRLLVDGFIGVALLAALALILGAGSGLAPGTEAPPSWMRGLIQAGFACVSLCGAVLAVLDLVRIKGRPVMPAAGRAPGATPPLNA